MDRPSERKKVALSTGLEEAQNGTEDSSEGGREGRRRGGGGGEGDAEVALYKWAGQAEMVRAGQKDELYTSQLQGMILESAQVPPLSRQPTPLSSIHVAKPALERDRATVCTRRHWWGSSRRGGGTGSCERLQTWCTTA